jgi:spermidine synthase
VILDRVPTGRGELVLRETEGRLEIISNGVFLMDTSDGTSERLLVDAAVSRCAAPAPRLLIGGLGVGFSLARAVMHDGIAAIDVVEIESTVIAWHERYFRHITGDALKDFRVRVINGDVAEWLARADERYDAICLDTDNGPNWLVFDGNAALYTERGQNLIAGRLRPGGVLAVWSASRDPAFERRLRDRFGEVEILETPHVRAQPDVVYVARVT